jgi:hypothetical protein
MAGITRVPRSRGVLSGLLLILLGAWGGLAPFIGPYFHFAYTPDKAWAYSTGRLWLEILPGLAALLGGFVVLASSWRPLAMFGAFVAALGGAWFVVGNSVSSLWNSGTPEAGVPVGSSTTRLTLEALGFFTGLGVLIVFFAALALGRFAVVGVKDAALAGQAGGMDTNEFAVQPVSSASSWQPPSPTGDPFPPDEESLQPTSSPFAAGRDQSPTLTSQFPPAASQVPPAESQPPSDRDW